ncbi:hypothetical protein BDV24DRAFT_148135 [Aspergillus arachidicola]|uniref:F-box domain-containing protein n=1 Tax=Aspergillus arachidicola TaxID=656916 RepID=A0A5N6YKY7_9EURO|nr:hypothetical protein BDV24DRAFT_148135 [Aspergillus arachidicola]
MVTRGLWNLHGDGKWYLSFHPPRGRITSPDSPATLKAIRNIISATTFNDWESVPFPTPLHIDFDYVYKIDKDLGILIITKWSGADGVLSRLVRQAKLAEIQDPSLITVEVVLRNVEDFLKQYSTQDDQTQSFAALKVDIGIPSSLNEHQFRFFPDFVLLWKFYFDDVATWVGEPLLNTLAIAILRTAALDFEVWPAPAGDIFWFHGFLVTLYSHTDVVDNATEKARAFLDRHHYVGHTVCVIVISLSHVTLLEISGTCVQRSSTIPLITACAHTEPWEVNLPFEVFDRVLEGLPPKDIISFAQASFASHNKCVDRRSERLDNEYTCSECRQNKTCSILETGGIYGEYRKKKTRSGCKIAINGSTKSLSLRLGKPANRRPELWRIRGMPVPPKVINYTIYFNGVFSGLAYGLDE